MTETESSAQSAAARIREAWVLFQGGWVHVARLVIDFQEQKQYLVLGFSGMDEWLAHENIPRATIYRWIGLAKKHKDLPPETLGRISRLNAGTLLKLPEGKRYEPDIIAAAETQANDEFRATVQKRFGNLHLENKVQRSWWVDASLAQVIDEAMELAKSIEQTESDIDALEAIFSEYGKRHDGET